MCLFTPTLFQILLLTYAVVVQEPFGANLVKYYYGENGGNR